MKSVISREKHAGAALAVARENLHNVPRIYTEIALEQMPGNISFFEHDVPAAFASVKSGAVRDAFERENRRVIAACNPSSRECAPLSRDATTFQSGNGRVLINAVYPCAFGRI